MQKKDFEKFYQDNVDKIYRFVFFRIGGNKELAEDLVSEIFMKALEKFESYDDKISRSAWIFTIAKNHLINHWRDTKPTASLTYTDENGDEVECQIADSIDPNEERLKKAEIYELLAKLEPKEKDIVTFHYLMGYNYCEIAQMLGSSETAVKVAAHRAVKKMRKFI